MLERPRLHPQYLLPATDNIRGGLGLPAHCQACTKQPNNGTACFFLHPSFARIFSCAEMATAASTAVSTASEAMATISAFQYVKQPKLEGHKTPCGVATPEPSTVARHRTTSRVAVKQEATAAVVKNEATGRAVVKEEAAVAKQETTGRSAIKREAKAPVEEGAGLSRGSQDNASKGNLVKREKRRVGGARVPGPSSPKTMKREKTAIKKSPIKAERKVKIKAEQKRKGGENYGRKKIPPRLIEKAALIINVMDALYPDPPIPINHVVRGRASQRERESRVCTRQGLVGVCFLCALLRGSRFPLS